jgi:3-hydroxyacyl-[acyl-carrier-protein] dehydratase
VVETTEPFGINKIKEVLPHRYPFLLLDRVLSVTAGPDNSSRRGRRAKALKNVSVNEMFFNGHFPESPIMPGVLIIEALAQCGAMACYRTGDPAMQFVIARLDSAKFRRPVIPGDQLMMEAEVVRDRGKMIQISTRATVDGDLAAEAEILAHVVPRDSSN